MEERLDQQALTERMDPASTTKVMTAIVALKYGNLSDLVTVPEEAVITESGSSMAGVVPGDEMSLEDLLYGLMIPSATMRPMPLPSMWEVPLRASYP